MIDQQWSWDIRSYNGRLLICFHVSLFCCCCYFFVFSFFLFLLPYLSVWLQSNFRINQTACQPIFIWLLCIRVYYGFCFLFFFSICAIIVLFNSFEFYTVHCVAYFFCCFVFNCCKNQEILWSWTTILNIYSSDYIWHGWEWKY